VEASNLILSPGKSSKPDGFTSDFFHHCWQVIKLDVWDLVKESQRILGVLPALNATFLSLIPKEEKVLTPISFSLYPLCNVIYKIISKVISLVP
jgi:hypothetical protein